MFGIASQAQRYLLSQLFYRFGLFFSQIFLVIFLWKGKQSLDQLALYFLVQSVTILLVYYPCGLFARWTSPLFAFRWGVSLYGVSYGALLVLPHHFEWLSIWIGFLTGIAESFWSVGTHMLTMEIVANEQRDSFSHYHYVFTSLAGVIAPFLAGSVIPYIGGIKGYFAVFVITTIFILGSVLCSFSLQNKTYHMKSNLRTALRTGSKAWKQLLQASFFWIGAESLLKPFLLVMALYLIVKSEWWVGTLTTISSLCGILASLYYAKVIQPQNRQRYYLIAALCLFFMLFFWLVPAFWSICLVMIVVGITTPALDIPMNTVMYEVIDAVSESEEQRLDFITVREIPLGLGRIAALLFFLFSHRIWTGGDFLYLMLIVFSGFYLMVYGWIRKLAKTK